MIADPEGQSATIEVEGHIVWSQEKKAYGVEFFKTNAMALERLAKGGAKS